MGSRKKEENTNSHGNSHDNVLQQRQMPPPSEKDNLRINLGSPLSLGRRVPPPNPYLN